MSGLTQILVGTIVLTLLTSVRVLKSSSIHIVDGDTVEVRGRRWRLASIDAPEWDQPYGRQASRALKLMLADGPVLVFLGSCDRYGRRLAWLWTRDGPVSMRMIMAGHAHATGITGLFPQIVARLNDRGLWANPNVIKPWHWRHWRIR